MSDAESTFERIYRANYLTVYRLALAKCGGNEANAKDVFGEVFYQLLRYLRKGGGFNDAEHEKAWLIRVTLNCSKAVIRTYSSSAEISVREFSAMASGEMDVYDAVMRLPEKYRVVIHLYYYEGYSVKEISSILRRKENTVKAQLSRGRSLLKCDLGGLYYGFGEV